MVFLRLSIIWSCVLLEALGQINVTDCSDLVDTLPFLDFRGQNDIGFAHSDKYIAQTWYTSSGKNGRYQMTDNSSIPSVHRCGTTYPIYLSGRHPDYDTISSEPTKVKACLRTFGSLCFTEYDLQIRKCHDEIQYLLQSTTELSAYCFDLNKTDTDIKAAPIHAIPSTVEVQVNLVYIEQKKGYNKPELRFKCSFDDYDSKYHYYVYWFINGNYVSALRKEDARASLTEDDIMDVGFGLGITLRCGIRVAENADTMLTNIKKSKDFFAGIKVNTTNVVLLKGGKAVVELEPTVPVGCAHNNERKDNCFHLIHLFNANKATDKYMCDQSYPAVKDESNCGTHIQGDMKNTTNTWKGRKYHLVIMTTYATYSDQEVFILQMITHYLGQEHRIWQNYIIDYVTVTVSDSKKWQYSVCKSEVDPHMTTADGHSYENQNEKGVFMLYRNKKNKIEVHERIKQCVYFTHALCACAVSVRAGGDVFTVNLCNGGKTIEFMSCEDKILQVRYYKTKNLYEVTTPIGTIVKIQLTPQNQRDIYLEFINTLVYMSPGDINNTDGLCGYFDGVNVTNDFVMSTGEQVDINSGKDTKRFIHSWKFGGKGLNLSEADSYIEPTIKSPDPLGVESIYCVCLSKTATNTSTCSKTKYPKCKRKRERYDGVAKRCNISKRKRSISLYYKELKRKLRTHSRDNHMFLKKRSEYTPPTTDYTQDTYDKCYAAIMNSYLATDTRTSQNTLNASIYACAFDITQTGDESFVRVHIDSNNRAMEGFNKLDVAYSVANPDTIIEFENQACLGNCYGKGSCNLGVCECIEGYKGADCTISVTSEIHVEDIEYGGFCDLAEVDECRCFSVQTYKLDEEFICQVTIRKIMTNSTTTTELHHVKGVFEDIFNGICCIPESSARRSYEKNSGFIFTTEYEIAISNDGLHFGNGKTVYVFDSFCQEYTDQDGNITFSLKTGFCFIDGVCIQDLTITRGCYKCLSQSNALNWTRDCEHKQDEHRDDTAVVAGVAGAAAFVLFIAISFGIWYKLHKRSKKQSYATSSKKSKEPFSSYANPIYEK